MRRAERDISRELEKTVRKKEHKVQFLHCQFGCFPPEFCPCHWLPIYVINCARFLSFHFSKKISEALSETEILVSLSPPLPQKASHFKYLSGQVHFLVKVAIDLGLCNWGRIVIPFCAGSVWKIPVQHTIDRKNWRGKMELETGTKHN